MPNKVHDISNIKFNMLLPIERVFYNNKWRWRCLCDCGKEAYILAYSLKSGGTKSCGCLSLASLKGTKKCWTRTHGNCVGHDSSEYTCWKRIRYSCRNPKSVFYKNYGGRGINICDKWFNSFECFINDMGKKPTPNHSIERIDVNGDYEPSNCIWATIDVQAKNRRTSVKITFDGKTMVQSDWAKYFGITPTLIWKRLKRGETFEFIYNYYKNGLHETRQKRYRKSTK